MVSNTFVSVYNIPAVQRKLAELRAELERKQIPTFPIGRAYIPGLTCRIPSDQEWVQRAFLR